MENNNSDKTNKKNTGESTDKTNQDFNNQKPLPKDPKENNKQIGTEDEEDELTPNEVRAKMNNGIHNKNGTEQHDEDSVDQDANDDRDENKQEEKHDAMHNENSKNKSDSKKGAL
jgi:hypothetical protein